METIKRYTYIPFILVLLLAAAIFLIPMEGYHKFILLNLSIVVVGLGYIRYIGKKEKKYNVPVHYLIWFIFIIHIIFIFRKTAYDPSQGTGGVSIQIIAQLAIWALIGLYTFIYFIKKPSSIRPLFQGRLKWLLIYAVIALISTTYSPDPKLTFAWTFKLFVALALLSIIVDSIKSLEDIKKIMNVTYFALGFIILAVYIGVVTIPADAVEINIYNQIPRLGGSIIHSANVAILAAILGSVAVIRFFIASENKWKFLYAFGIGLMGITLFLTRSRTEIFSFLLAILIILIILKKIKYFILLVLSNIALFTFPNLKNIIIEYTLRGQTLELFLTGTGRIALWKQVVDFIMENPILGHGYAAFNRVDFANLPRWEPFHTHNAFLEILAGTGIIGLIPFIIVFLGSWFWFIKKISKTEKKGNFFNIFFELFIILLILTFHSFLNKGIGGIIVTSALLFLLIISLIQAGEKIIEKRII